MQVDLPPIDNNAMIRVVLPKDAAYSLQALPGGAVAGIGCRNCIAADLRASDLKASLSDVSLNDAEVTLYCARAHLYMHPPDDSVGVEPARASLACSDPQPFDIYIAH